MLQVCVAFGSPTRRMLVLELNPNDAAALVDLMLGNDRNEFLIVPVSRSQIVRGAVADLHSLRGDPLRDAPGEPFGAVVRAGPYDGEHSHGLDFRQPSVQIEVVPRLEHAGCRLLSIPEDIRRD